MIRVGSFKVLRGLCLVLVFVGAALGCGPSGNKPNVEIIQDMMESPAYKAQEAHPDRPELGAMREPPKGTLAKGSYTPHPAGDDFTKAKSLVNPLKGSGAGDEAKAAEYYGIYCLMCHGDQGQGNGVVYEKSNKQLVVPSLITDRMRGWEDGEIYHLIVKGRGLMKGYEVQIPNELDRWAIVNHVRKLQRSEKGAQ